LKEHPVPLKMEIGSSFCLPLYLIHDIISQKTIIFIISASEFNHLIKSREMRWARHVVHMWRLLVRSELASRTILNNPF
jgi:hypothetical protein